MRIAHVVCVYPPYGGGMGRVAYEIVEALNRQGEKAFSITPEYASRPISHDAVEHVVYVRPLLALGNGAYLPQLFSTLSTYDIIHLHYPFFGSAHLVALFRLFHPHIPLVVSMHMDPVLIGWRRWVHGVSRYTVLPLLHALTDAWVPSTFDYVEATKMRKYLHTHPTRWHEIPFGVDTNRFTVREKQSSFLMRHGFSLNTPTILFVGGMDTPHAFKGVSVLLQSLAFLREKEVSFQVFCVGKGELRETYIKEAHELGLETHVQFLQTVPDEELPLYYQHADVCVLPSTTMGEAFGLVLLEAMACGTPVVASDLPGLRVVAQVGGEVVPPSDPAALSEALLRRIQTVPTMVERQTLQSVITSRFSWDAIGRSLVSLYHSLVTKG